MNNPRVEIKSVEAILESRLSIPDYQRPYKWNIKHVQQLIDDLVEHFHSNKNYRIGTVILHKNDDSLDIVDGQQRITTLTLILLVLGWKSKIDSLVYRNTISHSNIYRNYHFIKDYLNEISANNSIFLGYLLIKCEMVLVELDSIDEAFQFFDSQNSRGKPLEPHDLLKAYHLRAIPENDESLFSYVENWENAIVDTDKKDLKFIINLMLFRLRRWQKGKFGFIFTKDNLDTFKGVNETDVFPYILPFKSAQAVYNMYRINNFLYNREFSKPPFSIIQPIINGRLFFSYVEYYRNLHDELFNPRNGILLNIYIENKDKKKNVLDFITSYEGVYRTGDRYVREMFESIILYFYDKFGNNDLEIAVRKAIKWSYFFRITKFYIREETIENAIHSEGSLLSYIDNMVTSKEIKKFEILPIKSSDVKRGELIYIFNLELRDETC